MTAPTESLRRTPLHARHAELGAKLVPFAGWEMPVQYEGVRPEHEAVRAAAGLFDVSHMGEVETAGPDAARFLQRALSNDVDRIAPDGAQYSVLCRPDGGVLDDLFTYRLGQGDRFLTVTNAANHEKDLAHLNKLAADEGFDVTLTDRIDELAMLALQGPNARAIAARLTDGELPKRMRTATRTVAGVPGVLVCGTGYTGEDGVELLVPADGADAVWQTLVGAGATPAGLAARDTLRLEACFHLYGNDLMEERGPIAAGLHWCCKEQTGFVGAEAVAAERQRAESDPDAERLVPFAFTGPGIPRQGNPVVGGGVVTSGTMSPSLGIGIGMAYVPTHRSATGGALQIDVRGRQRDAEIRTKPLYSKET